MRKPGSTNDCQPSVAGQGPRQSERGVQKRNDQHHAMKRTFISSAVALVILAYPAHASAQQAASADKAAEASFMAKNQAAMSKMTKGMAVKPSGNIDADFTAMMIPHHQGAVDMAQTELRYGHNRKLRQIARNIIAEQRTQIGAMKAALGQPLFEPTSSATSGHASQDGARPARSVAR